jgi:asparagine synthase (glutamine-hydrolysing)
MPSHLKIRRGSKKWILKDIYEPQLPPGLAQRRKQGFELPVNEWLRGPLRSQFQDVVLQDSASIADFIDTTEARRMYEQHGNHTGQHG